MSTELLHQELVALRQSEEKFRSIVENANDLIFLLSPEGSFTYVSPNFTDLLGYDLSELEGKSFVPLIEPEDLEICYQAFESAIATGQKQSGVEYRVRHKNSSWRWHTLSLAVKKDANHQIVSIIGVARDITERKQVEQRLHRQAQFLQSIWDGVDYGIFVLDVLNQGEEFRYANYNLTMASISPVPFETLLGRTVTEALGAEAIPLKYQFQECIRQRRPLTFEQCFGEAGAETWWHLNVTPLQDGAARIYQLVVTVTDITERKRIEQERIQAEEALRQSEAALRQQSAELEKALRQLQNTQAQLIQTEKMSGLGQLVAGVAHEINNPVNFIYGNLAYAHEYTRDLLSLIHLYQKHYPDPVPEIQTVAEAIDLDFVLADLPRLLTSMKVGADRIQGIVTSLRTFSRMDEAEFKAVDIHEGIDSALMILQNRLKARHNRPEVRVIKEYGNLPLVACYAGQLNQVFMNILANALDALEERDSRREIEAMQQFPSTLHITTEMPDKDHVTIRIADNGPGMTEFVRQRLFDPFFTTKPVGKGTGMGLSISYQIVTERHQGTLQCFSSPGQGAEFVIKIPIRQK